MRSIELFTGAGGLALGVHRAGFHHLAVVEYNRDACQTLRLNSMRSTKTGIDWPVVEADVRTVDYSQYPVNLDLLAGGSPCQPFSLGGKHAGDSDRRNMFPEVFRAVRELRPRAFLLENVRGLARESFRPYLDYIVRQLALPFVQPAENEGWIEHSNRLGSILSVGWDGPSEKQYVVAPPHIVNVADYGAPQQRHRVFIIGFRRDLGADWSFPSPTHSEDSLLYSQYVDRSYWTEKNIYYCHGVPPDLESRVARLSSSARPSEERWRTVRDAIADLPEPRDRHEHAIFDNHVGIPDARIYPGHTGSPWDWPAKAIKAGDHGNPGGENMLRRDDGTVRYFSVRELARLQTFPDEWHFAGSWTEIRRQLGNAVPVKMGELLARRIAQKLVLCDQNSDPAISLEMAVAS